MLLCWLIFEVIGLVVSVVGTIFSVTYSGNMVSIMIFIEQRYLIYVRCLYDIYKNLSTLIGAYVTGQI